MAIDENKKKAVKDSAESVKEEEAEKALISEEEAELSSEDIDETETKVTEDPETEISEAEETEDSDEEEEEEKDEKSASKAKKDPIPAIMIVLIYAIIIGAILFYVIPTVCTPSFGYTLETFNEKLEKTDISTRMQSQSTTLTPQFKLVDKNSIKEIWSIKGEVEPEYQAKLNARFKPFVKTYAATEELENVLVEANTRITDGQLTRMCIYCTYDNSPVHDDGPFRCSSLYFCRRSFYQCGIDPHGHCCGIQQGRSLHGKRRHSIQAFRREHRRPAGLHEA